MNGVLVRRLAAWLSFVALFGGIYLGFVYRQDLIDTWRLFNYKPSAEIIALADAATMDGRGRNLFYASDPEVNEREAFNQNCTDTGEESLVLGCYAAQRIYLYNVTDPKLNGVKEVTAAHEMLHAAYERLGQGDKDSINALLEAQLAKIKDERLNGLIELYNQSEPGQLFNEMHSILGTEFGGLSSELETYYKQYFTDRGKVVAAANAYAKVFTESQERIANYDKQLDDLKNKIDSNSAELDKRKSTLDSQANQLDFLRNSDAAAYNSAVPTYNANVRTYNNLATQTRNLVTQYNNTVQSRNGEVAAQNDLYHSLDSKYESVGTN